MSDLLQEIDEAVRRDKAAKFWKENGSYIIGGAVALVVLTGVFTGWNTWKMKQDMAQTDLLVAALSSEYQATALGAATGTLKGGHRAIARIQQAAVLIGEGKPDEALPVLATLRDDSRAPALWRDLGTLMYAKLAFADGTDATEAKALYDSLKPVLRTGNPWYAPAQMLAATLAGEGLNDGATARTHLGHVLRTEDIPPSMAERAQALDRLYMQKSMSDTPETKTGTTESEG